MAFISVEEAVTILQKGGVVAVPTETVYGLAADATNKEAIERIYQVKNRPADNPLICHFDYYQSAMKYVVQVPPYVKELAKFFLPGPLSLLLKLAPNSPLLAATVGRDSVIIRVPAHPVLHNLLKRIDFPLAAPSANTSGRYSATSAEMVEKDLGNKIDGIIDGGESSIGLESTIIDCREQRAISILRPGAIGVEEIRSILKDFPVTINENVPSEETTPGSKYRHYAPETPVRQINSFDDIKPLPASFAVLLVDEQKQLLNSWLEKNGIKAHSISLGSLKSPNEIAQHLYKHLQQLDELKVKEAYLLKTDFGNSSVGKALANRIHKIAGR